MFDWMSLNLSFDIKIYIFLLYKKDIMDEDNILGISVLVGIFGTIICCGGIFICRSFTCTDNQIIINPNNLLENQSDIIN